MVIKDVNQDVDFQVVKTKGQLGLRTRSGSWVTVSRVYLTDRDLFWGHSSSVVMMRVWLVSCGLWLDLYNVRVWKGELVLCLDVMPDTRGYSCEVETFPFTRRVSVCRSFTVRGLRWPEVSGVRFNHKDFEYTCKFSEPKKNFPSKSKSTRPHPWL